jgi:hypothetical protein
MIKKYLLLPSNYTDIGQSSKNTDPETAHPAFIHARPPHQKKDKSRLDLPTGKRGGLREENGKGEDRWGDDR